MTQSRKRYDRRFKAAAAKVVLEGEQTVVDPSHGKRRFSDWLQTHQGTRINPDSVFDVQAKRLHEYKRQQLNLLWAIRTYLDIRSGKLPERPVTVIFGAKAAPAYTIAKDIIHVLSQRGSFLGCDQTYEFYGKSVS